jgi:hypothetical protein
MDFASSLFPGAHTRINVERFSAFLLEAGQRLYQIADGPTYITRGDLGKEAEDILLLRLATLASTANYSQLVIIEGKEAREAREKAISSLRFPKRG